jgi:protein phosphatase
MGGHDAGELASALLVEEFGALVARADVTAEEVRDGLARARVRIGRIASSDRAHAAGTTVSGVVLVSQCGQPYWLVVNIGDSRTYRLAKGVFAQQTVDHSEVQELLDAGTLEPGQAEVYARRNVVTRVLGGGTVERPEFWLLPVEASERWLVCSDGLTSVVAPDALERALREAPDARAAAETLLGQALASGARDNVSVIVLDAVTERAEDDPTVERPAAEVDDDTVTIPEAEFGAEGDRS